jgi:peptide/nickel transport system permease protein
MEPIPVAAGWQNRLPWRQLLQDKPAALSLMFLVLMVLSAVIWPIISPYEVTGRNLPHALLPPFTSVAGNFYLLGTDGIGRDMLTRILAGGRVSLSVAAAVAVISGLIGVSLGMLAGYMRGRVDDFIMRVVDVFMAMPTIFFVLVVLYVIGTSTINLIAVMSIARWMLYCRMVRALVLSMREQTFIKSARALGASDVRIMTRHLVPNILAQVLTVGFIDLARVILLESSISFLGLGLQPPAVSWGLLVADGRVYIKSAWWMITMPGLFIFLTALSTNLFGLWLRMVNDPIHRWRYLRKSPTVAA